MNNDVTKVTKGYKFIKIEKYSKPLILLSYTPLVTKGTKVTIKISKYYIYEIVGDLVTVW